MNEEFDTKLLNLVDLMTTDLLPIVDQYNDDLNLENTTQDNTISKIENTTQDNTISKIELPDDELSDEYDNEIRYLSNIKLTILNDLKEYLKECSNKFRGLYLIQDNISRIIKVIEWHIRIVLIPKYKKYDLKLEYIHDSTENHKGIPGIAICLSIRYNITSKLLIESEIILC